MYIRYVAKHYIRLSHLSVLRKKTIKILDFFQQFHEYKLNIRPVILSKGLTIQKVLFK